MQLQEFLDAVLSQRMYQRAGERAPHKPLTVLYALGRAVKGERLTSYSVAESDIARLLSRFGPPRDNHKPEQPAWRLLQPSSTVQIWDIAGAARVRTYANGDPNRADLCEFASIGLSASAFALFHNRPADAQYAATCIAEHLLPSSIQGELLEAVGLSGTDGVQEDLLSPDLQLSISKRERVLAERSRRNAMFSRKVLAAYGHRCAVCSVAPKIDDRHFGLEAAHIRWVEAGGPDDVCNGICLCRMHHVALDRGALTLRQDFRVEISTRLSLDDATRAIFEPFHGRLATIPLRDGDWPHKDALDWHRNQVFKRL